MRETRNSLSANEVRAYGLTAPLDVASSALGIGRTKGQQLARSGEFPVRVLRIGSRYRVPTAELLAALGVHSAA